MSPALQRTNLPPSFIITLQGMHPLRKKLKIHMTLLETGIMHTVPCFEEVWVLILFHCLQIQKILYLYTNN